MRWPTTAASAAAAVSIMGLSSFLLTPPGLTWARRNVQPPGAHYITVDDRLAVVTTASFPIAEAMLNVRMLSTDGRIRWHQFPVRPDPVLTVGTTFHQLQEGYILSACLSSLGAILEGRFFVQVYLGVTEGLDFRPGELLMQGYVSDLHELSWPNGTLRGALEGPGFLRSITGTDPAAGAEVLETVTNFRRWRLQSIRLRLVTDATVANRFVSLVFDDGVANQLVVPFESAQVASQTALYSAGPAALRQIMVDLKCSVPLPVPMEMRAGWRFGTATTGLQAGDNWQAPIYVVEEHLEQL